MSDLTSPPTEKITALDHTRRSLFGYDDPKTKQSSPGAVSRILHAWPHAREDAEGRGYPARASGFPNLGEGGGRTVGSYSDPTASFAARPEVASQWLRELQAVAVPLALSSSHPADWVGLMDHPYWFASAVGQLLRHWPWKKSSPGEQMVRRIIELGNTAAIYWAEPPKMGETVEGVVVGDGRLRTNDVELCAACGEPVVGGKADPLRRLDGKPYHGQTCFYRVWRRQRVSRGVS